MIRASALDCATSRSRRVIFAIVLCASLVPIRALSQDVSEDEIGTPVAPTEEEATPRRRGSRERGGGTPTTESTGRRGTGTRDQVGTDTRRGGARDEVAAPSQEPTSNENLRNLPTGESPTSVSPQSIRLPSGEGTIEGMGESFTPMLSAGTATYSVPIGVPPGRNGVQPSFGLSYSSSGGNGIVGIGWSIGVPMISRQTDRGTPSYRDSERYQLGEDRFIYNGGQELVPVDNATMAQVDTSGIYPLEATSRIPAEVAGWQQYRAKIEGSFMRFFRSRDSKRWIVQSLDGSRFEFGLLPVGTGRPEGFVETAALQSEGANGTGRVYAWLLTRMSDAHGSTIYYEYSEVGTARYIANVYYLSPATCVPSNWSSATPPSAIRGCTKPLLDYGARVHFDYETRSDAFTTYISGWGVTQGLRLSKVTTTAAAMAIGTRYLVRRYHLGYDPNSFHSLLTSVMVEGRAEEIGAFNIPHSVPTEESAIGSNFVGARLPPMTFQYSSMPTSGPIAAGFGGLDATVHNIENSPPVSLDAPLVDLFDVNGDGLQDVMVTDAARYRTPSGAPGVGIYWNGFTGNTAAPAGHAGVFSNATVVPLTAGADVILRYSNPNLLGMDVDGDGRGDFMHLPPTLGHGWITPARSNATPAASPMSQGWQFVHTPRAIDVANDPQIKLAQDGTFYRVLDVNNDHLIDIVRTTGTSMQTWLNLGWVPGGEGRFGHADLVNGAWVKSPTPIETCLPHDGLPLDFGNGEVRLGDMNGDGLTDIIRMRQGRITYWPGRGGPVWGEGSSSCPTGYATGRQIEMTSAPAEVNVELAGVFLNDVDGDGADDVVQVRYHQVDVWFNRAGQSFTSRITIQSPYAPDYAPNLRFVDIDGSGTTDLVYGRASQWQYVDLLGGHRPRLLTVVANGLGATTTMEYGSSVEDYTRDLQAAAGCAGASCESFTWDGVRGADACDSVIRNYSGACVYRSGGSPVVSTVVRRVSTSDNFRAVGGADQVSTQEFAYHDGYYEGIEQEFRGFGAADAHLIGDATVPGQWTRAYFHQGRRPNDIATTRLSENPEEALKGGTYLSEVFDEGGRFVSSTHSSMTVRRLATGLDGRLISFAFGMQSDHFLYDTTTYQPQSATVALDSYAWEVVGASGTPASLRATEQRNVRVRAGRFLWTRSSSENTDNFGAGHKSTATGRLHDEDDGASPVIINTYDEAIVSESTNVFLPSSEGGWIVRGEGGFTYDASHPSLHLGESHAEYNDAGDSIHSTQPISGAPQLDFGPTYTTVPTTQTAQASSVVDAFGSPTTSCGGANIATQGKTACLRYATLVLDPDYRSLPVSEAVATTLNAGGTDFITLPTSATWDRGRGAIVSSTDANGGVTQLTYDGLGRSVATNIPDGYGCNTLGAPETVTRYVLPSQTGANVSYVETTSDSRTLPSDPDGTACTGARLHRARAYFDGLGRARGGVAFAPIDHPNEVLVSGIVELDARGNPRKAYDPRFAASSGEPDVRSILQPNSSTLFALAHYDTFGRVVAATSQEGAVSRTEYHATSILSFDPNDDPQQNLDAPQHHGTPHLVRNDGHGRAIESVEMLRQPGELTASTRYIHLVSKFRADGKLLEVGRAETQSAAPLTTVSLSTVLSGHFVTRTFTYDSSGRRVTTTDPDSDSRTGDDTYGQRHWRYLFNPLGELAAVRDPRGCGQDFFYDRAGRLVGEDYIGCGEADPSSEVGGDTIQGAMGLNPNTTRAVDVRNYYDARPSWGFANLASVDIEDEEKPLGRATASVDRAQRSMVAYDIRGNAIWAARQVALIPEACLPAAGSGLPACVAPVFDPETYITQSRYDGAGRAYLMKYPTDPDWSLFATETDPEEAPTVMGTLEFDDFGRASSATVHIESTETTTLPVLAGATYDAWGAPTSMRFMSADPTVGITQTFTYDRVHRPLSSRVERGMAHVSSGALTPDNLNAVQVPFFETYAWDRASNLTQVTSNAGPQVFPAGYRQSRKTIDHDSLYRVAHVAFDYLQDDRTWGPRDAATDYRSERTRINADQDSHETADPMRSRPAPMLPSMPEERLADLTYSYDWLANQTLWDDDARSFFERSIGDISNGSDTASGPGADPTYRPSALYVASNIRQSADVPLEPSNGWLDVDYGAGGNVVALTARAQCTNLGANQCVDDPSKTPGEREAWLLERCTCANEQRFEYQWDELNRLSEARRYDRQDGGSWRLEAHQRARYDAGSQRIVKESVDPNAANSDVASRIHLYVIPGDFERTGVRLEPSGTATHYAGSDDLDSETEYHVASASIVHQGGSPAEQLDRRHRATMALRDLLGTATGVVDLESGALIELATFTPNGARETHWMEREASVRPERNGFTGKEEDEEVGVHYFGQRYLIARIGRWASPDPLATFAAGGGEVGNAFHYVGGNVLQSRDPIGLNETDMASVWRGASRGLSRSIQTNTLMALWPGAAIAVGIYGQAQHARARYDRARGFVQSATVVVDELHRSVDPAYRIVSDVSRAAVQLQTGHEEAAAETLVLVGNEIAVAAVGGFVARASSPRTRAQSPPPTITGEQVIAAMRDLVRRRTASSDAPPATEGFRATDPIDWVQIAEETRLALDPIADQNRVLSVNVHESGLVSGTGNVKPTPQQQVMLGRHGVEVPAHGEGLALDGPCGHHAEQRGIAYGEQIGDPVVEQHSSGGAAHGGEPCASCAHEQAARGIHSDSSGARARDRGAEP